MSLAKLRMAVAPLMAKLAAVRALPSASSSKAILTPDADVMTPQPPDRHSEIGTTPYTYASRIGTPMLTATPATRGDTRDCDKSQYYTTI